MRRWVLLIAAGAALSGCKSADRDRPSRGDHSPADPASRTKTPPAPNKDWLGGPNPGLGKVDTPPADSWADPRGHGFDADREVRGVLGGFVEDPDGRKVRDVFIEVEPVEGSGGGAPVGVQTGPDGYFLIKGLKPKQTYQLTARVRVEGRELAGRVYAQTSNDRSQFIRLSLIDGLTFPGGQPGGGRDLPAPAPSGPKPAPPPPAGAIPPPVLPSAGSTGSDDGAWSPTNPGRPVADPPKPPGRPDLVTENPAGVWRPPAANIPTTGGEPKTVTPPPAAPGKSQSRSVKPGATFALVDTLGRTREFPSGQELVLLDFMTTTCLPCRKALPEVKELQARYGLRGLEVVGVACDDADLPQRRALASAYQRAERLNYLLYAEPSVQPGKLMRRFKVESFPTLVLLDGSGEVLWRGHPKDAAELDRLIADRLDRRTQ